MLFNLISNVH